MTPKKTTGIICAIILVATILIIGMLYRSDANESSTLLTQYNKNTQQFDRNGVSTVIEEVKRDNDVSDLTPTIPLPGIPGGTVPSPGGNQSPSYSNLAEAMSVVHHMFGHAGLHYTYGSYGTLGNGDRVRTDCSGYLSYALAYYGVFQKGASYTSANFHTAPGLVEVTSTIHSVSDLQAGDILCYSGHVEMYAGNNRIYNWGGHASAEDKYVSCSGHDVSGCTVDATSNLSRAFATITHVMRIQ